MKTSWFWLIRCLFLFADRLNAGVRFGQRDIAEAIQDPHHLFLVDHDRVGLFQNLFQHRVLVLGLLATMFDVDIVVDHAAFERAGAIQRRGGDDVVKVVGLHPLQQVANAARFQLEDALGFAALQQGVVGFVVEREFQRIDCFARRLFDQLHGAAEDGQVAQTQKIHLQQTRRFDVVHRPLRDHVLFARHAAQRHIFGQRFVGDHDGGGVRADVACQTFDLHRQVQQFADLGIAVVGHFQVGALFQRLS